ncbi:TPA: Tn7 transposase TnsA N-terminal domain-containing protein [Vibrio harveyi]|nr:Tn7 transposase TnsA N-terminal domain-containing protein [Vibrio harveyi]
MKNRKLLKQSPVRETRYSYSPKFGRVYYFESSLERDCFNMLLFQDDVTDIVSQPDPIAISHNGRIVRYTADFWVKRGDKEEYIEVKPYAKTLKPEFEAKVERIKKVFANDGATFSVITERDIYIGCRAENCQHLKSLRHKVLSAVQVEAVRSLFQPRETLLISELQKKAIAKGIDNNTVLTAIANGVLSTDLSLTFDQLQISVL